MGDYLRCLERGRERSLSGSFLSHQKIPSLFFRSKTQLKRGGRCRLREAFVHLVHISKRPGNKLMKGKEGIPI